MRTKPSEARFFNRTNKKKQELQTTLQQHHQHQQQQQQQRSKQATAAVVVPIHSSSSASSDIITIMTTFPCDTDDDVVSTINVMLKQEEGYRVSEYLTDFHLPLHHHYSKTAAAKATGVSQPPPRPVDADCRFKTAMWYYQVIDFWRYHRETVSIAMSCLDRFLSTKIGRKALQDRRVFQLASITCLYTALKVHEPVKIEPHTFAQLSRGLYTAAQIETMERVLLETLEWKIHPPTAKAFLHYYFALIPSHMITPTLRASLLDISTSQIELAVGEYVFATLKASTIATSALFNAVDSVDDDLARELRVLLSSTAINKAAMDCNSPLIEQTQDRLFKVIERRPGGDDDDDNANKNHLLEQRRRRRQNCMMGGATSSHPHLSVVHSSSPRSVVSGTTTTPPPTTTTTTEQ